MWPLLRPISARHGRTSVLTNLSPVVVPRLLGDIRFTPMLFIGLALRSGVVNADIGASFLQRQYDLRGISIRHGCPRHSTKKYGSIPRKINPSWMLNLSHPTLDEQV